MDKFNETFRVPRILTCGHTICQRCVEMLIYHASQRITCPLCKHPMVVTHDGVEGFPKNFGLLEALEQMRAHPSEESPVEMALRNLTAAATAATAENGPSRPMPTGCCGPCFEDGETTLATHRCETCVRNLCFPHFTVHNVQRATRDHEVREMGILGICNEHPAFTLDYFCPVHARPICFQCCMILHKDCVNVLVRNSVTHLFTSVTYVVV
jgi:hypothetical protein